VAGGDGVAGSGDVLVFICSRGVYVRKNDFFVGAYVIDDAFDYQDLLF
jgi:hypothetical protein